MNATKKKLRASYNKGYLAAKRSSTVRVEGTPAKIAAEQKRGQQAEVVLTFGDLSISIKTDK